MGNKMGIWLKVMINMIYMYMMDRVGQFCIAATWHQRWPLVKSCSNAVTRCYNDISTCSEYMCVWGGGGEAPNMWNQCIRISRKLLVVYFIQHNYRILYRRGHIIWPENAMHYIIIAMEWNIGNENFKTNRKTIETLYDIQNTIVQKKW